MTEKRAKELSLEVWRYLAEHPEIAFKNGLPGDLYSKISDFPFSCPLCELFIKFEIRPGVCLGCPLTCSSGSDYDKWVHAIYPTERGKAAQSIVAKIEAWEVNNDT